MSWPHAMHSATARAYTAVFGLCGFCAHTHLPGSCSGTKSPIWTICIFFGQKAPKTGFTGSFHEAEEVFVCYTERELITGDVLPLLMFWLPAAFVSADPGKDGAAVRPG